MKEGPSAGRGQPLQRNDEVEDRWNIFYYRTKQHET